MNKTRVRRGLLTVGMAASGLIWGVVSPPPARGAAEERLAAAATLGIAVPADASYRELYGGASLIVEGWARVGIRPGWFAWAGYGGFADSGSIAGAGEARSRQSQLSLGAGYGFLVGGRWPLDIRIGICSLHYKEEALETSVSGSAPGFRLDADFAWPLGRGIAALASAGYITGRDERDGVVLRLGGVRTGLGLRFVF